MGVDVRAPDGRVWTVRRRIRWPRWRGRDLEGGAWPDGAFLDGDDAAGLLVAVVAVVVIGIVFALVVLLFLPLVVFVVEAVLVLVAAVLLGRPWLVVASTLGPPAEERTWRVRGVLASRRAVREVADELRAGVEAAPREAVE